MSADVTEFTVDGVDIVPADELGVDRDEYRTGSGTKRDPYVYHYNSFVGTYMAGTAVPEQCLSLIDDRFVYSTGETTLKAFRAYFDFYDVLGDTADDYTATHIGLLMDGKTVTGIGSMNNVQCTMGSGIYDLQGRKVSNGRLSNGKMAKGLYIVGGKKVSVN